MPGDSTRPSAAITATNAHDDSAPPSTALSTSPSAMSVTVTGVGTIAS